LPALNEVRMRSGIEAVPAPAGIAARRADVPAGADYGAQSTLEKVMIEQGRMRQCGLSRRALAGA
jgi:hypothetical protein